jgi:radical SAM superfamily enzyme YgiQ (UPF0313 family)
MLGVPRETSENVRDTIRIIRESVKTIREQGVPRANLSVSVSQFVPKAGTPFQWYGQERQHSVEEKMREVRQALRREKNLELHMESPRWCAIQGLLARADRRMGAVLRQVYWDNSTSAWAKACRDAGLDMDDIVHRDRSIDEVQPWKLVQTDALVTRLAKERNSGEARMEVLMQERGVRQQEAAAAHQEAETLASAS